MNERIMKKFTMEMKLGSCLKSIKECTSVASDYIEGNYEINDVDELIVALRSVEEDVEEIEQIVADIEEEYESEIEELKYEQLQ
ncbi:MAG: hypothetical protein NC310_08800 [Roseburia sp.]|nr:hypothetical protein [Roseburia sp.]